MKDERRTLDAYTVGFLLSVASLIYLIFLKSVYFLYRTKILRSHKAPRKVISVGNITLGGTGKTPFAIALAGYVKRAGKKPAVLNRGYGDDESHLLKEKLKETPVLLGRDRVKNAAKAFNELGSDCVILDDGFQHHRIKKDLDIVLIDATCPFGNMKLFPRGILREPLTRLKDADIAILTKTDMGGDNIVPIRGLLKRLNEKIEIVESFYQPIDLKRILTDEIVSLSYIAKRKIAVLAGIANPNYFEWMVGNLGAEIRDRFFYPDHHPYSNRDIAYAAERCIAKGIDTIITTEKDTVRLKRLKAMPKGIDILALRINFRVSSNEKTIVDRLHSIFNR